MIVPDSNFRLNPDRSIYVNEAITFDLITKLTPAVVRLQTVNRDSITVYIDSPGGQVSALDSLVNLLRLPTQDSQKSCRIITAVTTLAASAAADLLASGDYAIAFPNSTIVYHGIRTIQRDPLTVERSSTLADSLRQSNDIFAMTLAKKIQLRFLLRYLQLRFEEFPRIKEQNPNLGEVECLINSLASKLSPTGIALCRRAQNRYGLYQRLIDTVLKAWKSNVKNQNSLASIEARHLHAIINYEVKLHKKDRTWSFQRSGLQRLAEDFFLLTEYINTFSDQGITGWCVSMKEYFLSTDEANAIDAINDEQQKQEAIVNKVKPFIHNSWAFFIALCHALQEQENELTAIDAYWIGLVDEVLGNNQLVTMRDLSEKKEQTKTTG